MQLLLEKIVFYTEKKDYELQLIQWQYKNTMESLRPINLLKNSILEKIVTVNPKSFLLSLGIGLATNFLSNKIQSSPSSSPIKRMLASVLNLIKK
jgi:hypothetical protein